MFGLEVDTLMTSSGMARVGVALLFTVLGLKLDGGRHFLLWAASLWLAFLAFMLEAVSFHNYTADLGSDLLADITMGASVVALGAGLLAFEGMRIPLWTLALVFLPVIGHAGSGFVGLARSESIPVLLAMLAIALLFPLAYVWRAMRANFMFAHVVLLTTLTLQLVLWLVPALLGLLGMGWHYSDVTLLVDVSIFAVLYISLFALDAERSRKQLERLATTDTLTGLSNRRGVLDALTGGTASGAVLVADIDKFKQINDRWGHAAGDLVLQEFSRRLQGVFRRASDVTGRWGGEEFIVIALGLTLEAALARAEALRQAIAEHPFDIGNGRIDVTVSIGVTSMTDGNAAEVPHLVERADVALYEAKQDGRNRVKLAA